MIPAGFLADILATPADDTVRLVLADWLEENGQGERGEFIRLQCELMGETDEVRLSLDQWQKLAIRQEELIRTHLWRFLRDELPDEIFGNFDRWDFDRTTIYSKRDEDWSLTFTRGFISRISCRAADWLSNRDDLKQPLEQVTMYPPHTEELKRQIQDWSPSIHFSFATQSAESERVFLRRLGMAREPHVSPDPRAFIGRSKTRKKPRQRRRIRG